MGGEAEKGEGGGGGAAAGCRGEEEEAGDTDTTLPDVISHIPISSMFCLEISFCFSIIYVMKVFRA